MLSALVAPRHREQLSIYSLAVRSKMRLAMAVGADRNAIRNAVALRGSEHVVTVEEPSIGSRHAASWSLASAAGTA